MRAKAACEITSSTPWQNSLPLSLTALYPVLHRHFGVLLDDQVPSE